ncbi:MAG: hypothetical protein AB7T49_06990 [Oligoflexales bacterium]
MRNYVFSILTSVYLLNIGSYAIAYGPCDEDEEKFCASENHGETVKTCLHTNIDKLSKDCKAFVLTKHDEWKKSVSDLDSVKEKCKEEGEKFCGEEGSTQKPYVVCLMTHGDHLSKDCKTSLNQHITNFLPTIKTLD